MILTSFHYSLKSHRVCHKSIQFFAEISIKDFDHLLWLLNNRISIIFFQFLGAGILTFQFKKQFDNYAVIDNFKKNTYCT